LLFGDVFQANQTEGENRKRRSSAALQNVAAISKRSVRALLFWSAAVFRRFVIGRRG
jgi:hypothetical protein